jgi:insulysin
MLNKLTTFKVDPKRFDKVVDQVKLHWKNFELSEPYHVAMYWYSYVSTQAIWTQKEKLAEIEHITPADIEAFAREVFQRLYFETLVHGNTTIAEAKGIQDMIERVLHPRALVPAEKSPRRTLLLPEDSQHVWTLPVANPSEVNNCVIYSTQTCDPTDAQQRSLNAMLVQIVSEPAFNVLRTKEQLGYVVQASATRNGLRVLAQSERDPVYVESRIEAFLEDAEKLIEDMPEATFEGHRESLILKREEKPKNLGQESRQYWQRISDKYYEFAKSETEIAELRKVNKADVLAFFKKWVHPASPHRRKLSVHMKSQAEAVAEPKFDPASAAAIVAAFTKHGVPVDQAALQQLMSTSPELAAVKAFATQLVDKAALDADATAELKALTDALPPAPEPAAAAEAKLRAGNVAITDIHAFKDSLTPAKAAVPLEPLVPSKL